MRHKLQWNSQINMFRLEIVFPSTFKKKKKKKSWLNAHKHCQKQSFLVAQCCMCYSVDFLNFMVPLCVSPDVQQTYETP